MAINIEETRGQPRQPVTHIFNTDVLLQVFAYFSFDELMLLGEVSPQFQYTIRGYCRRFRTLIAGKTRREYTDWCHKKSRQPAHPPAALLCIDRLDFTARTDQTLVQVVRQCPNIESIVLFDGAVSVAIIDGLVANMPSLQSLTLVNICCESFSENKTSDFERMAESVFKNVQTFRLILDKQYSNRGLFLAYKLAQNYLRLGVKVFLD